MSQRIFDYPRERDTRKHEDGFGGTCCARCGRDCSNWHRFTAVGPVCRSCDKTTKK